MAVCAACALPILDRYLLNVCERSWHAECLRCSQCATLLSDSCFMWANKLVCRSDYDKLRLAACKCSGCGDEVRECEMVRKASDGHVFHPACFKCCVCFVELETDEKTVRVSDDRYVCEKHWDLHVPSSHPSDLLSSHLEEGGGVEGESDEGAAAPIGDSLSLSPTQGRAEDKDDDDDKLDDANAAKRRGPRTTIKAKQLETLKNAFACTPKPTRHIREQLAHETGLNMRVIQVWFQNRRSKERRMKQVRFGGFRPSRRNRSREETGGTECLFTQEGPSIPSPYFSPPPPLFYCDMYGTPSSSSDALPSLPPFESSQSTLLLSSPHSTPHQSTLLSSVYTCDAKPPLAW